MSDQLTLDVAEPRTFTCCGAPFPGRHVEGCATLAWFHEDGTPRRLLWCSDAVRIGFNRGIDVPCPYLDDRARFRPAGGCCKELAA